MRSSWIRLNPKSNDKCPPKRQERRRHTDIQRPCDDGGGGWSDAAGNQAAPRSSSKDKNLRESCEGKSPSEPPEGTNPAYLLISDFWPS